MQDSQEKQVEIHPIKRKHKELLGRVHSEQEHFVSQCSWGADHEPRAQVAHSVGGLPPTPPGVASPQTRACSGGCHREKGSGDGIRSVPQFATQRDIRSRLQEALSHPPHSQGINKALSSTQGQVKCQGPTPIFLLKTSATNGSFH